MNQNQKVVVVVDDYEPITVATREMLKHFLSPLLEKAGMSLEVVTFTESRMALECLITGGLQCVSPDLLITDLEMGTGRPNGFTLARKAKELCDCPVIMVTGADDVPFDEEKAVNFIFHKPADGQKLSDMAAQLLGVK